MVSVTNSNLSRTSENATGIQRERDMNDVQDNKSPGDLGSLGRSLPGQVVLVLQGGGALGSYQAGVYQALHEAGIEPDWIIGTSIGAINASLIAGNEPRARLSRLQEFWKRMEQSPAWNFGSVFPGFNEKLSYWSTITHGVAGFFRPNPLAHAGDAYVLGPERAGYYTTTPLQKTLEELVDFDLVNRCKPRRSDHREARDGVRRAAAGLSGRAHRGRALLGRRHLIEHADGGRVRRQSAQGLADLLRPPVESGGLGADHDGGGVQPAQGCAVFQPDRQPDRAAATDPPAASRHQPACHAPARGRAQQRCGARIGKLWVSDPDACGTPARAAARSRNPHQGHRLQPGWNQATLGRRLYAYEIGTGAFTLGRRIRSALRHRVSRAYGVDAAGG